MAAKAPTKCCTNGVKHEGEPSGKFISIDDDEVKTYVARPVEHSGRAIVLLPDVIGHASPNAQLIADQFAANGYVTVVPDLFNGNPVPLNPPAGFDIYAWLGNFPPEVVDLIVQKSIDYLKKSEGASVIGAVGYCFGGKYVVRFLGKGISVGYTAHPSMVAEDEFASASGPLRISAAETDAIWPAEARHKTEGILAKTGHPWEISVFSGVEHGFGIRGDLSNSQVRFAKEEAFFQAVSWFNEHLK